MHDPAHAGAGAGRWASTGIAWAARSRRARIVYLLTALVLIVAYQIAPGWARHTISFAAAVATIPALLVGTRRIGRERRAPWTLLLSALVLIIIANVVRLLGTDLATAAAQLVDAVGNVVVLSAALVLVAQQGRANLGSIIDTSIAALALGGLLWALVLEPNLAASSQTHSAELALFIVIFALSGVLGALVQMIIQRPVPALWPLVLALALALVSDIIVAVTTNRGLMLTAATMTLGAYVAIGLFGLDPTAEQLITPAPARPDRLSPNRLIFLGLAVAVLPIVIGTEELAGGTRHAFLLVVSTASITALVMVRIGQLSAQRDQAEAALRHEASHDPLTGLPNRKEFTRQLSRELRRGHPSAVIFCDLNRFKAINDRFGHTLGDQVLVEVAHRLSSCLSANELVSRLGGDEFVILLRRATHQQVQAVNARITDAVDRPMLISDQAVSIGVTTGTAFATEDDVDPDDLIERADHAMYLAKTDDATGHAA